MSMGAWAGDGIGVCSVCKKTSLSILSPALSPNGMGLPTPLLKGATRPSIGSGRFTKSPLPIAEKPHKKRPKNTAAAGVWGQGHGGGRGEGQGRGPGTGGHRQVGLGWAGLGTPGTDPHGPALGQPCPAPEPPPAASIARLLPRLCLCS